MGFDAAAGGKGFEPLLRGGTQGRGGHQGVIFDPGLAYRVLPCIAYLLLF
jgi:hypothetical protein